MADHSSKEENPLQGYYDWQVTTLLLAHDLADPIPAEGHEQVGERRRAVEQEVRDVTLAVVPEEFKQDPNRQWPPEVMMAITRATLERARDVAGI